jgi:hypothetical protein
MDPVALAWAVAAVAVSAVLAWRARRQGFLRRHDRSLEAWRAFGSGQHSGPQRLLAAAVLAASPHNSQPWRFTVQDGEILVHADLGRSLGAMDPFERELFIGLGCALENMGVAAPGAGLAAEFSLLPASRRELAARVALRPAATLPPRLEAAIPRRHTDRGAFRGRPLEGERLRELTAEVGPEPLELLLFPQGGGEAERFAALTLQATQEIVDDAEMSRDSARWHRHEQRRIDRDRDGLTPQTQGLAPWLDALARMLPEPSIERVHRFWLKHTRRVQLPTASHFGFILVPAARLFDDRLSMLVGGAWQRLHLCATLCDISCQAMNQIPQRISRERQLGLEPRLERAVQEAFGLADRVPSLCFRLGQARRAAHYSPRRTIQTVTDGSVESPSAAPAGPT